MVGLGSVYALTTSSIAMLFVALPTATSFITSSLRQMSLRYPINQSAPKNIGTLFDYPSSPETITGNALLHYYPEYLFYSTSPLKADYVHTCGKAAEVEFTDIGSDLRSPLTMHYRPSDHVNYFDSVHT